MTIFDVIVILVLLLSTALATVRGALIEIATLLALAIAGLLSFYFAPTLLSSMGRTDSVVATLLTHGALIALFFIFLYVVMHVLSVKFPLAKRGTQINRIIGGAFGFLRGYLIIGLGFLAYGYYLDEPHQHDSVRDAMTRPFAASGAEFFEQFIPQSARQETGNSSAEPTQSDAASNGYDRSDRAGLAEVITTVTTSDTKTEQSDGNNNPKGSDNDPQ